MDKPQPSPRGNEEGCWAINMTALDKEGKFIDSDRKLFRAATLEKALVKASDYANWNLGWISHSIIVEEEK